MTLEYSEPRKPEQKQRCSKSAVERIVICLRWAWCWQGFWRGWWNEVKGLALIAWHAAVAITGIFIQIFSIVFFPLWRLLIEPVSHGVKLNDKGAGNLEKIIASRTDR